MRNGTVNSDAYSCIFLFSWRKNTINTWNIKQCPWKMICSLCACPYVMVTTAPLSVIIDSETTTITITTALAHIMIPTALVRRSPIDLLITTIYLFFEIHRFDFFSCLKTQASVLLFSFVAGNPWCGGINSIHLKVLNSKLLSLIAQIFFYYVVCWFDHLGRWSMDAPGWRKLILNKVTNWEKNKKWLRWM